MKKIESLRIYGRRWFQESYGNTYHTVKAVVNGEEELTSGITYGYGEHYLQTAADLLRSNGYDIPENNMEAYSMMTKYKHTVVDVDRKRDLDWQKTETTPQLDRDSIEQAVEKYVEQLQVSEETMDMEA